MSVQIDVELRGRPEVDRLLDEFQGSRLTNRVRRAVRAGAAVFRGELRRQAGSGRYPRSFRKTRTTAHRSPIGVSVGPASPLVSIFEEGAARHQIGDRGQLLANRETGFRARGPVSHPGMGARPLIGPVWDAKHDAAEDAATDTLFEGMR